MIMLFWDSMENSQIVSLLIAERDRLQAAIDLLQGPVKKRGRPAKTPPSWVTSTGLAATVPEKPARKKRQFTSQQRAAQAKRMKAYWKAKKKSA